MIHKIIYIGHVKFLRNDITISKNDLPSLIVFYNNKKDHIKKVKCIWNNIHMNHRDNDLYSFYSNSVICNKLFVEIGHVGYFKYNFIYKYNGAGSYTKTSDFTIIKHFNFTHGICIKILKMNVE